MIYHEDFNDGPAGWWGWVSNSGGPKPLEHTPGTPATPGSAGTVTTRSPWWIDYNHAPPGAGYLHMLFCTFTRGPVGEHFMEVGGKSSLIAGRFPTDYTNAAVTLRLKGELETRGAELVFLVQAAVDGLTSAWVLTGQPFRVTNDWSQQTVTLTPDESQWTCLCVRHDRGDMYGRRPLSSVLRDVNIDIMLVMFPLTVAPMGAISGDPHILRPEKDYPVWRSRLPEGYVTLDSIRIAFADNQKEKP